ncbi:MAG TPA: hypothetical protein PK847_13475 [Candidatus Sumerlaeota bacterium]|nr:hypothetical protein [Candidatus Sumerlaeota bacterium]
MDPWAPGLAARAAWQLRPESCLGAAAVAGCLLLLGWPLLPRPARSWWEQWLLRAAAGCVALPILVLVAGQVRGLLFTLPWRWLGLAGWLAFAATGIARLRASRRTAPALPGAGAPPLSLFRLLALAGWICVGHWHLQMLWPALSPPLSYDVLEYHLALVTHGFATGRFEPIPGILYTRQPVATEALFTLAAAAEGWARGAAPGLLNWLLFLMATLLFAPLARRLRLPAPVRPWLWLAVLAHPLVFKLQLDNFTDWTGALLMLAGLLLATGRRGRAWAFPLGLCAGGAVAAKWTNAGTVALPLLAVVVATARGKPTCGRELAGFGAGAAAALAPWLIWLGRTVGNPFAPFLAGLFPTDAWSAERLQFLLATHQPFSPLDVDYWTNLVRKLAVELDAWPMIAVALVLSAGAVALRRRRGARWLADRSARTAAALLLGLVFSLLLWGQLRHAADRFLAPVIVLSALLLGDALRVVQRAAGPRRGTFVMVSSAVILAALALWPLRLQLATLRALAMPAVAMGRVSLPEYLHNGLGATAAMFAAVDRLPADARLIAIHEARGYYFRRPVALASVFDRTPIRDALRGADSAESIRRRLADAGYTHVLVNEFEQARLLAMHPPLRLEDDPRRRRLVERDDQTGLVRTFPAEAEFAVDPPPPAEKQAYLEFLAALRARPVWIEAPPAGTPAIWIADLRPTLP